MLKTTNRMEVRWVMSLYQTLPHLMRSPFLGAASSKLQTVRTDAMEGLPGVDTMDTSRDPLPIAKDHQ